MCDGNRAERICSAHRICAVAHGLLTIAVAPFCGLSRVVVSAYGGTSAATAIWSARQFLTHNGHLPCDRALTSRFRPAILFVPRVSRGKATDSQHETHVFSGYHRHCRRHGSGRDPDNFKRCKVRPGLHITWSRSQRAASAENAPYFLAQRQTIRTHAAAHRPQPR